MVGKSMKDKGYFNKYIFKFNDYELYKVIHNLFKEKMGPPYMRDLVKVQCFLLGT